MVHPDACGRKIGKHEARLFDADVPVRGDRRGKAVGKLYERAAGGHSVKRRNNERAAPYRREIEKGQAGHGRGQGTDGDLLPVDLVRPVKVLHPVLPLIMPPSNLAVSVTPPSTDVMALPL